MRSDLFERQIARLIAEIKASRELITTQRAHTQALEDRLAAEQKNSLSFANSLELAAGENKKRKQIEASLQEAVSAKNETITVLTAQRNKERRRAGRANKRLLLTIGAAVAGFLVLR